MDKNKSNYCIITKKISVKKIKIYFLIKNFKII